MGSKAMPLNKKLIPPGIDRLPGSPEALLPVQGNSGIITHKKIKVKNF
jgi:hypothetical protein